jgi:hypothetical protein
MREGQPVVKSGDNLALSGPARIATRSIAGRAKQREAARSPTLADDRSSVALARLFRPTSHGFSTAQALHPMKSVIRPRITIIAVPAILPIATDHRGSKLDRTHKLRALPGIKFWDDHPSRTSVFPRQRLSIQMSGNQDIVVQTRFRRDIGAVAVITFNEKVVHFGLRLYQIDQREECDAAPLAVELRPSRDAVKIAGILETRQLSHLTPGQLDRVFHFAFELKRPLREQDSGLDT